MLDESAYRTAQGCGLLLGLLFAQARVGTHPNQNTWLMANVGGNLLLAMMSTLEQASHVSGRVARA